MSYTTEDLEKFSSSLRAIPAKYSTLVVGYRNQSFEVDQACEFARNGFLRRLIILKRCIEKVFDILPPSITQPPDNDRIIDATVYLQTFVFNTFGCVDNLAHVWAKEKRLTSEKDGRSIPIPDNQVGFGKDNKVVLDSLPTEFRDYLKELRPWLKSLENFRHALAHRIPLYIPPCSVPEDRADEYNKIEECISEARWRGDCAKADQLEDEKNALVRFEHLTTHSFGENAPKLPFHTQMIDDFLTVEEIAQKLLREFG